MDTFLDFISQYGVAIISKIPLILAALAAIALAWSFFKGVFPALWRLGLGLSKRKIAVFANSDHFASLKSLLLGSGLFQEQNIVQIPFDQLDKAADYSLFLLRWGDCKDQAGKIIDIKHDSAGLVLYAPHEDGTVTPDVLTVLNNKSNALLVNFQGRLLNDILVLMITTSYTKNQKSF